MATNEQFSEQMQAAAWELKDGVWCKTVESTAIDPASMSAISGAVNAKPFKGAPPHTLKLLGPNWMLEGIGKYAVTYRILPSQDMDGYDQHPVSEMKILGNPKLDFVNELPA